MVNREAQHYRSAADEKECVSSRRSKRKRR
jgi:hypothetical protein